MFTINVGSIDRLIRIVLGLAVLSLFFVYPQSEWRYFSLLGLVPLLTGIAATCPLYSLFGMSTCPARKA